MERRKRRVSFEETAKGILRYPRKNSEDLKGSVTELQLPSRQEKRTAQHFSKFSGKEKKRHALPAGPDGTRSQKGLEELEKRCQEVNLLSERQELFRGMVEDKIMMQSRATEEYYWQIFEEMKELEDKKSEEALLLVQKKYDVWRYQNERDEARRLQRSGSSRRMKKEADFAGPFLL